MMFEEFYKLKSYKTRSVCPENPTGKKGKAAMADPEIGSPAEHLGKGWKARPFVKVKARDTMVLADIMGEGEIKSIWITGAIDQGIIIKMFWDDAEVPSVECPVPEFFLYGWSKPQDISEDHWNKGPHYQVNSALMTVNPNRGFNCYLPMPFRKRARIILENRTTLDKEIWYQINYEEKEVPDDDGYLHAEFRVSMPVPYQGVHTILDDVQGRGVYIGTALYVGLNRAARWWGEGEVKFYLDGDEEYPTICTTGLEDYFGGAFNWDIESNYMTYSNLYTGLPYIQRPDGLYEVQQRFSLYRWHVTDPIRFENNLRITVQDLGWIKNDEGKLNHYLQREDDFMSVAYWYQDKPAEHRSKLIDHKTLIERF